MLEETPKKSPFRNPLTYTSLLLLAAALYTGWTLYSRRHEARAYDERAERQRAQQQHARDQAAVEQLGGSELAIETLYATP